MTDVIKKTNPQEPVDRSYHDEWKAKKEKTKSRLNMRAEKEENEVNISLEMDMNGISPDQKNDVVDQEFNRSTGAIDRSFGIKLMHKYLSCTEGANDKEKAVSEINSYLVTMNALEPADEMEGMLCTQILSLNEASMKFLSLMCRTEFLERAEKYCNMASKLMRLHNEKIEALARYRRKGTQQVIVQHVNVESGGQAVVGAVNQGGGDETKKRGRTI